MENRLATSLGTTSNVLISREMLMAQDDIKSTDKMMDTIMVKFDQKAIEEDISSGFETLAASHPPKMFGIESRAHAQPSPTKVGEARAVSQGAQGMPPPNSDLPQVVGGLLPPLRRNLNGERHQR